MSKESDMVAQILNDLRAEDMIRDAFPGRVPSVPVIVTALESCGVAGVTVFLDVTVEAKAGDEKAYRPQGADSVVQHRCGGFVVSQEDMAMGPGQLTGAIRGRVELALRDMRAIRLWEMPAA